MPTNLACSTACFRHTSIDVALEEIRLAGFQAIDLNLIPGLCDHFDAARQSASEQQPASGADGDSCAWQLQLPT